MCPIEWHHYWRPLVTLKVTFAVCNPFVSHNLENAARVIYDMFTHESESAHGL